MRTDPETGAPLLRTPSGVAAGSWRDSDPERDPDGDGGRVAVFRAVPIAAPHSDGVAAFSPARPAPAWGGILDCGDSRRRRHLAATHTATVYCPEEPENDGGTGCPVMAWVHGGRFETGHADEPWYDGTALARQGCVVVALNYRTRFEGFLPLAEPEEAGKAPASPADFRGVDDLVLGLRWIRDCIGDVGGDPGQVTLAGQSAGGALVAWLLTDDRASDLFHRAVLMSPGAPRRGWTQRRLTTRLSLGAWRGAPSADSMGRLSPAVLSAAYRRFARLHVTDCAVGVYPYDLTALRPVPVLVGTMHDEFVRFPGVRQADSLLRRVLGRVGLPRIVDAWLLSPGMLLLGVPPRSLAAWCRFVARSRPVRPMGRTVGDRTIRRWASAFAEALADRGAPVWAYEFRGDGHLAQHCGELPLLFDTLTVDAAEVEERCGPDAVRRLGGRGGVGERFRGTGIDFVHGRDPGWRTFRTPDREARIFDLSGGAKGPGGPVTRTTNDPWSAVRRLLGPLY